MSTLYTLLPKTTRWMHRGRKTSAKLELNDTNLAPSVTYTGFLGTQEIIVWSVCYFLRLLRILPTIHSLPAPYLEKPLLLSNLWLSGSHGVLRQGHWGKVWMCGSQHRIDSSTHQRALLKRLMIQPGKEERTCFQALVHCQSFWSVPWEPYIHSQINHHIQ